MPAWVSILPPVLAIIIAIWKKEVVISLFVGIWLAEALLLAGDPTFIFPTSPLLWLPAILKLGALGFIATIERGVQVLHGAGDARVLIFGLLVGALIELMQSSGGVAGFVQKLVGLGLTKTKRRVSLLTSFIGILIFVETSMSCLAAGLVSQRLFDRFQMSRARLAFIVDSTCAPISVLVLFNAWGAYILGLIGDYGLESPVKTLAGSVLFNFYPLLILVIVFYTSITSRVFGPMKKAELEVQVQEPAAEESASGNARYMLIPLAILIGAMFFFMWFTGKGKIWEGSGSSSVLWSVILALVAAMLLLRAERVFSHGEMMRQCYTGMGKLLPVVVIMLLSFAIGTSCKALGTGPFVAGLVGDFLPSYLVAPLLFLSAAIVSFTTGTSWGTFAILIPLGLPLGFALDLPHAMVLASILGGGVFGDHCSPISDTTIIASLASGCDHLEHVKTQLPYAISAGLASMALYLVMGLLIN